MSRRGSKAPTSGSIGMLADPWKEVHQGLDEGFDCSTQLAAQEGSPIAYEGLAGSEKICQSTYA